jgi:6-pyruvoyltetrahydropterin/6-carboxytetrahydropterin synthase
MAESFHVRLTKDYLVFSCAHFITFAGNICERLHGHNYGLEIEVSGPLDENAYVIDFIALRDAAKRIVDRLDHHVLLPLQHDRIRVRSAESEVVATFEDRRWVFPAEDCILLPVYNTTAEEVARYIGGELIGELGLGTKIPCDRLRVGVDENNGQWGYWTTTDLR